MSTHNNYRKPIKPFFDMAVLARVRGGGRELSGVGALTISICRRVCHGARGGHGGMVLVAVRAWLLG